MGIWAGSIQKDLAKSAFSWVAQASVLLGTGACDYRLVLLLSLTFFFSLPASSSRLMKTPRAGDGDVCVCGCLYCLFLGRAGRTLGS